MFKLEAGKLGNLFSRKCSPAGNGRLLDSNRTVEMVELHSSTAHGQRGLLENTL
ncbi:MAG: hypothetical protein Q9181_006222 [Wetmoreana brouardii]